MKDPYRIEISISLNQEQFDKLTFGSIPESMDDHWFVYFESDWIYCHRSWTGYLIFKCQIQQIGSDRYEIKELVVERDINRYGKLDYNLIIGEFKWLIDYLVTRRMPFL